uniref:Uncharacterized protein n=1 Tax=Nymphaea colorata TaxID=210225 RepID=A0A5K1AIY0_9MAGN
MDIRTTMRTPTNATPAELVYGTEVVLPLHVLKPALKFASLIELPLNQYQQKSLMQLDLLDKKRLKVVEHIETYHQRVALPRNSYQLNVDGVELDDLVNALHLKKLYT